MALLATHLEQISLSAIAIAEFPDTESHERALFSVPPPPPPLTAHDPSNPKRRTTAFHTNGNSLADSIGGGGINAVRAPRRNTAVAAVLGGDMVEQIRRGGGGGVGSGVGYPSAGTEGREKGEVDVEVLLKGAEKFPIPNTAQKISSLRTRYTQLASSISHYEARVNKQAAQLDRMNRGQDYDIDADEDDDDDDAPSDRGPTAAADEEVEVTEEDLRKEEEEIRELERKKRMLEERVSGMERDLGGLLR
ncbi:hypothetical protein FGG08_002371 [Glutinoglossum americanum]|uniref:DASH complex subunit SPC34 n=1 Tax=Glutinoglossum americanum TaxID=1670608 RepID=A0A9P8L4J8_9PEZI|nr:hypothetical protein FGG08_002371 [Glutinoglossum americanum]